MFLTRLFSRIYQVEVNKSKQEILDKLKSKMQEQHGDHSLVSLFKVIDYSQINITNDIITVKSVYDSRYSWISIGRILIILSNNNSTTPSTVITGQAEPDDFMFVMVACILIALILVTVLLTLQPVVNNAILIACWIFMLGFIFLRVFYTIYRLKSYLYTLINEVVLKV